MAKARRNGGRTPPSPHASGEEIEVFVTRGYEDSTKLEDLIRHFAHCDRCLKRLAAKIREVYPDPPEGKW